MAGGLALYEVLSSYADGFSLKWPNDVYWKDRKISGTLIETKLSGGLIKDCIFGIGLNVNQQVFVSDAPNPVSLCQILDRNVSTDEVLDKILLSFRKYYERVIAGDEDGILENYLQHLYRRKGVYQYRDAEGFFEAEIIRVEPTGILILRDVKGMIRKYAFKEVEFIIDKS
jgi:BirA family biotin operon repressor/biotin-[acetyl-CoA-carboxylase] ligase